MKELSGTVTVEVDGPAPVCAAIDNVLKAQNQSVKSKDSTITDMTFVAVAKLDNGDYRMSYALEGMVGGHCVVTEDGRALGQDSFSSSVSSNTDSVRLVDAKGNAYKVISHNPPKLPFGDRKRTFEVVFRADASQGEPARLKLIGNRRVGPLGGNEARRVNLNVPFSFKDVPLPSLVQDAHPKNARPVGQVQKMPAELAAAWKEADKELAADGWSKLVDELQARITLVEKSKINGTRSLVPYLEPRNASGDRRLLRCDPERVKFELVGSDGKVEILA